jgi:hypothetical protein
MMAMTSIQRLQLKRLKKMKELMMMMMKRRLWWRMRQNRTTKMTILWTQRQTQIPLRTRPQPSSMIAMREVKDGRKKDDIRRTMILANEAATTLVSSVALAVEPKF